MCWFLLTAEWCSIVWIHYYLLIHLWMDYLFWIGLFIFGDTINLLWQFIQRPLWAYILFFLRLNAFVQNLKIKLLKICKLLLVLIYISLGTKHLLICLLAISSLLKCIHIFCSFLHPLPLPTPIPHPLAQFGSSNPELCSWSYIPFLAPSVRYLHIKSP